MAALAQHSNVYNTALLMLAKKGYQLWKTSHGAGRQCQTFFFGETTKLGSLSS